MEGGETIPAGGVLIGDRGNRVVDKLGDGSRLEGNMLVASIVLSRVGGRGEAEGERHSQVGVSRVVARVVARVGGQGLGQGGGIQLGWGQLSGGQYVMRQPAWGEQSGGQSGGQVSGQDGGQGGGQVSGQGGGQVRGQGGGQGGGTAGVGVQDMTAQQTLLGAFSMAGFEAQLQEAVTRAIVMAMTTTRSQSQVVGERGAGLGSAPPSL